MDTFHSSWPTSLNGKGHASTCVVAATRQPPLLASPCSGGARAPALLCTVLSLVGAGAVLSLVGAGAVLLSAVVLPVVGVLVAAAAKVASVATVLVAAGVLVGAGAVWSVVVAGAVLSVVGAGPTGWRQRVKAAAKQLKHSMRGSGGSGADASSSACGRGCAAGP